MTNRRLRLLLAAASALAACRSDGGGGLPQSVIALHDASDPAGAMALALERDGSVREARAEIAIDALPAAVHDAAVAELPGALLVGAARSSHAERTLFELELWHEARDWRLVLDEEGRVIETRKALQPAEWPEHVLAAADGAVPGGIVQSIEITLRGDVGLHRVEKERGGARYSILVGKKGALLRASRRQRAELEIPLAE